jgi:hypothetical protein
MEKWKVALCKRAKTGRPASDWPNHLGWWPISVETREGHLSGDKGGRSATAALVEARPDSDGAQR